MAKKGKEYLFLGERLNQASKISAISTFKTVCLAPLSLRPREIF